MMVRVAKGCRWHRHREGDTLHVTPFERRGWEDVLIPVETPDAEEDTHTDLPKSHDRKAKGTRKR